MRAEKSPVKIHINQRPDREAAVPPTLNPSLTREGRRGAIHLHQRPDREAAVPPILNPSLTREGRRPRRPTRRLNSTILIADGPFTCRISSAKTSRSFFLSLCAQKIENRFSQPNEFMQCLSVFGGRLSSIVQVDT
jgi:hypothetical protein